MEEDIKILEERIKKSRQLFEEVGSHIFLSEETITAIEKLINRVKELEESEQYLYDAYQDAGKKMFEYSEKLEKLENRIKEKIEEYDKQRSKMEKADNGVGFTLGNEWSDLKAKIQVLQELMEDK